MVDYALAAAVLCFAGFTQGVTGFGSALVAMPLLSLFLDVRAAVPLCSLCGALITVTVSWSVRRHLDWRKIMPLVVGAVPGVVLGVIFLKRADPDLVRTGLGAMLAGYALFSLFAPTRRDRRLHRAWAYAAGLATGAIGGAFSAGGPPAIVYVTLAGYSADEIKATLSGFFFTAGSFIVAGHAVAGLTTAPVLALFAVCALPTLAGVLAGIRLYGRLDAALYRKVVSCALLAMGGMLILG